MITFNIAGAFAKYKEIMSNIFKIKKINAKINVYDSLSNSEWNGGRINCLMNSTFDEKKVLTYNKLDVGVFLTLSNYIIDINKKYENSILDFLNSSQLNGVIIRNESLFEHIRKNFKNLKISFSVTGFDTTDLNYDFNNLEKKYDLICPRYEWVFDKNFYSNVDVSKYNIMLNDCCKRNCKYWCSHFKAICDANRNHISISDAKKIQECWIATKHNNPDIGWQSDLKNFPSLNGVDLTFNDIKTALKIGYRNFKLTGRENTTECFLNELNMYLDYFNILKY